MAETIDPKTGVSTSAATFDDIIEAIALEGSAATHGVVPGMLNELAVTGASSPVAVDTGWAIVKGKLFRNTASKNINVASPSGATRIDRVVVRIDYTASPETGTLTLIAGAEGGAAPAVTQVDGTTWDLPLYQVSITTGGVITLTDERKMLHDDQVTTNRLADGALAASAAGRAKMAAGFFDAATVTAKVAAGAITATEIANRTRRLIANVAGIAGTPHTASYVGYEFNAGYQEILGWHAMIPADFVSGLKMRAWIYHMTEGTFNVRMQLKAYVDEEDTNTYTEADSGEFVEAARMGYAEVTAWTNIAGDYVLPGNLISGEFHRHGDDASDTLEASLYLRAIELEYTADS